MAYVIILVVLALAVYLISAPFRERRGSRESERTASRVAELEAARDAKYLEIRDAELDLRTGKLSDEDYMAIDRSLRAEAIEIMHALDAVSPAPGTAAGPAAADSAATIVP
ncbi:MAG: hypothetical protein ACR2GZ_02695 [Solirubrobacteraceae bacterium]